MSASSSLNVNVLWPKPSPLPSLRSPTLPPFIHPSFITPQPSLHPHLSVFFTFGIAHFGGQIGLLTFFPPHILTQRSEGNGSAFLGYQ